MKGKQALTKTFLLAIILLPSLMPLLVAAPAIRRLQTPKQMGLGEAGIAYPGLAEGLLLNPSFFSFFSQSSFSFLQNKGSWNSVASNREATFGSNQEPSQLALSLTDGTNESKGGVSYQDLKESGFRRKRYQFAASGLIDATSAIGISYSYITDTPNYSASSGLTAPGEVKSHSVDIGFTQVLTPQFSWALVWYDPAWADRINSHTVVGVHYKPLSMVSLLLDVGQDIKRSINKTSSFSYGIELEAYEQVFLRWGQFQDKLMNTRGSSWGLGWVGPRLGFDVAMKKTKRLRAFDTYLLEGEELKELAVSVLYIF